MWFRRARPIARLDTGRRLYAIGDIHGEVGLFQRLLSAIDRDDHARGPAATSLVLLGDIVDRGPHAADLIEVLIDAASPHLIVLRGNHEELMIHAYRGDAEALDVWLRVGGRATLASFGIGKEQVDRSGDEELIAAMRVAIAPALIDWLERLPSSWIAGDYFFAHAGIRPGVPLDEQDKHSLLWGCRGFLSSRHDHGKVVVHGHYIAPGTPRLGGNRIGLDTGGHERRRLTALGLEGDRQWLLQETD